MKIFTFRWRGITVELRWDTRRLCHFYRVKHPRHKTGVYSSRSIDKVFHYIDSTHEKLKFTPRPLADHVPAGADDLSTSKRIIDWQAIHKSDSRTSRDSDR